MNDRVSNPIHGSLARLVANGDTRKPVPKNPAQLVSSGNNVSSKNSKSGKSSNNSVVFKRDRPTRACTNRAVKYVDPPIVERRSRGPRKEKGPKNEEEGFSGEEENGGLGECSVSGGGGGGGGGGGKVVTELVNVPMPEQVARWRLRAMWELGSVLNFLHVFRSLLNIRIEFSAEELETALLTPNGTLGDVHIPLLKAIPPVTRMACGRDTWVTVLCRKLRDWWQWVAEGELPIVASQGAEIETYKNLDPAVRVVILKALCDIRVEGSPHANIQTLGNKPVLATEQDDIRSYIESYIDNSLKDGVQLSAFRKQRIGGDSHGISYWYEADEEIGHRLYREIRKVEKKVETKKVKTKGSRILPSTSYQWETVATNLDEFLNVSEKLFSSQNRTEISVGKKLKNDMIPEIEKIHKRKEKLLKKQHRQALLLDSYVAMDGLGTGRSLRDRKPVTYTFDDFDRSINEAINVTKRKQPSPEPGVKRELNKSEPSLNGRRNGSSNASMHASFHSASPTDDDEMDVDHKPGLLDRSSRRRERSQRYSGKELVGESSENEEYVESDDDIVGEAVYYDDDDEYQEEPKQKKKGTSSSEGEGDDWSDENGEDDGEEEDEENYSSSSEDSDQPRKRVKEREGRSRRATRSRPAERRNSGLRRSNRSTRTQINYQQYEYSESETESGKRRKGNQTETHHSDASDNAENSMESQDSDEGNEEELQETEFDPSLPMMDVEKNKTQPSESLSQDDQVGGGERQFLDLNELAPGSGFDDGPSALVKDDDSDDKGE